MPGRWHLEPAKHGTLIVVVGYSETGLEADVAAELAQQLGAEGVDRSALHPLGS